MTRLADILTPQRIKTTMEATSKEGIIAELVDMLVDNGDVSDREAVMGAILERESTRTTGVGRGLAIPHGKCSAVGKLMMAIGKAPQPVEFQSIDGQPVTLVVLLVYPASETGPHIEALARISRLLGVVAFRKALDDATCSEEIFETIRRQEQLDLPTSSD